MSKLFYLIISTSLFLSCKRQDTSNIPMFKAKVYGADTLTLKEIASNKVTFINIWSTFCGPCLKEMPIINSIHKKYKDRKDFAFMTIALNTEDEIHKFLNQKDTSIYRKAFSITGLKEFDLPTMIVLHSDHKVFKMPDSNIESASIANPKELEAVQKAFKIKGIPVSIILDKNGVEIKRITGAETDTTKFKAYSQPLFKTIDSLLSL